MIDALELSDRLEAEIIEVTSAQAAQSVVADIISSEILEKVGVVGVYAGIIPGTPPVTDPLSGTYQFELQSVPLTGSRLLGKTGSLSSWYLE